MPEFDEVLTLDDRTLWLAARTGLSTLIRLWRARVDWAVDLEVYRVCRRCSSRSAAGATGRASRLKCSGRGACIRTSCTSTGTNILARRTAHHRPAAAARPRRQSRRLRRLAIRSLSAGLRSASVYRVQHSRRRPRARATLAARVVRRADRGTASPPARDRGGADRVWSGEAATAPRLRRTTAQSSQQQTESARHPPRDPERGLVVTNDSAPLHFALSTHAKVVGLKTIQADIYLPGGRPGTPPRTCRFTARPACILGACALQRR